MTANDRLIKRTKDINAEYMESLLPTEEAYEIWNKKAIESAMLYELEMNKELEERKCGV